jgi:hypothetical protein
MWLNYGEMYCVSEDGEVMNRKTGLYLMPIYDTEGRLVVNIYGKTIKIHQMVAQRFCPKIDLPGLEVDHINRDQTDNRACNLRWCDRSINERNKNSSNISKHQNGYRVEFYARGKYIYRKWFKTMAEAIAARDAFKLTDEFQTLM